jgi:chaperone required for assembly of F1-ATPase
MRRFWTKAEAGPVEPGGFGVLLDGKPMRLPSGRMLAVGALALAEALAAEWQAAGGERGREFSLESLPLTRLVGTALDRIAPDPQQAVAAVARYGETDLLCYRADFPPALAARQQAAWQPLLDWAAFALDAPLRVTAGVVAVEQERRSLEALARAVAAHDPIELAALGEIVQSTGSLVLGLAVSHGRIGAHEAHDLATLDERFQAEEWGEDAEAEARLARIRADIEAAARLISFARAGAA